MTREGGTPTPGELGLPEQSALTVEGRLERINMMGTHLARRRRGAETSMRNNQWATGLGLILIALAAVIAATVLAYALS